MKMLSAMVLLLVGASPVMARQQAVRERPDSIHVRTTILWGPRLSLMPLGAALPATQTTEGLLKSNSEAALRYTIIYQPSLIRKAPTIQPEVASTLRLWITPEEDEVRLLRFLLRKMRDGAAVYLALSHLKRYGLSH